MGDLILNDTYIIQHKVSLLITIQSHNPYNDLFNWCHLNLSNLYPNSPIESPIFQTDDNTSKYKYKVPHYQIEVLNLGSSLRWSITTFISNATTHRSACYCLFLSQELFIITEHFSRRLIYLYHSKHLDCKVTVISISKTTHSLIMIATKYDIINPHNVTHISNVLFCS